MDFNKEDRVILTATTYKDCHSNPKFNTKFMCEGTIKSVTVANSVTVLWDNGRINYYMTEDLTLVDKKQYNSIW